MFPAAFIQQMQRMLDASDCAAFFNALQEEPSVSVRWNRAKAAAFVGCHSELVEECGEGNVPWCDSGRYLSHRPVFTLDPLLHGGAYYVQEASSMFLAHIVKQISEENKPLVALDLCAAPGGKSTLLTDFLPQNSLLVANEVIRSRVNILAENLTKWGNPNVVVTNNDPKDFSRLPEFFDAVFVDAPCSGEGMFRKDEKARAEWSEANVQLCAERQRRIVADVWGTLKVGGYLVYSTCTFNTKENEENVRWIMQKLGAENVKVDMLQEWGITLSEELQTEAARGIHAYRFFPHKVKGEGFFVAVLRKMAEHFSSSLASPSTASLRGVYPERSRRARNDGAARVQSWLLNPNDFSFSQIGNFIKAFLLQHKDCNILINNILHVVQGGITLAEIKGKDCIPQPSLALSTALNVETFPCLDLDLYNALLYLKKEIPARQAGGLAVQSQSKGFELVRYKGLPLGFVKNLGNRYNNLFPQEWRIRMDLTIDKE